MPYKNFGRGSLSNKDETIKKKFKKNQTIKFTHPSDLTGIPLILTGVIIGFEKEVRRMWPEEMGEAPDDMLLVQRQDNFGNTFHHAVNPEEIIQDEVVILKEEA